MNEDSSARDRAEDEEEEEESLFKADAVKGRANRACQKALHSYEWTQESCGSVCDESAIFAMLSFLPYLQYFPHSHCPRTPHSVTRSICLAHSLSLARSLAR